MHSCKFKAPYELVGCRRERGDCRASLYSLYGEILSLPLKHIYSNPDDERGDEFWSDIERLKIRIGGKYYSLREKEDNSIWLEESSED